MGFCVLVSIVVSIPACHAGDRGSIPRRGDSPCLATKLHSHFRTWERGKCPGPAGLEKLGIVSHVLLTCDDTPDTGPPCIGGSVVEFSPATREARVRFPANAVPSFERVRN